MAAPVYETPGTTEVSYSTDLTIDVPYPGTVNEGDLLILNTGSVSAGTVTVSTPSGWTRSMGESTGTLRGYYFWKFAAGTETGNLTVTFGSADAGIRYGKMYRVSGAGGDTLPSIQITQFEFVSAVDVYLQEMAAGQEDVLMLQLTNFDGINTVTASSTWTEEHEESLSDTLDWQHTAHTYSPGANKWNLGISELPGYSGTEASNAVVFTIQGTTEQSGIHYVGRGVSDYTAASTSTAVNYPLGLKNNDIVFCVISTSANPGTWSADAGWTQISANEDCIWWKRYDESEGVNANFSGTNSVNWHCMMFAWRGCLVSSTPYEQWARASGSSNIWPVPALAGNTTGANRVCVGFTWRHGASGTRKQKLNDIGTYGHLDFESNVAGSDMTCNVTAYLQAAAGNPGADTYTVNATGAYIAEVLALIPAENYANNVNTVTSANLKRVNGVLTTDILKVAG